MPYFLYPDFVFNLSPSREYKSLFQKYACIYTLKFWMNLFKCALKHTRKKEMVTFTLTYEVLWFLISFNEFLISASTLSFSTRLPLLFSPSHSPLPNFFLSLFVFFSLSFSLFLFFFLSLRTWTFPYGTFTVLLENEVTLFFPHWNWAQQI